MMAALAALLMVQQAAPVEQQQPPPDQADVVVETQRDLSREAVKTYVGQITQYAELQIARFHDPICPVVAGMPEQYGGYIARRIKDIARQLKLRVADKPNCPANILVVIAIDGAAFVRGVRSDHADWLAGMHTPDVDRLARPGPPVRAWSATSVRNEDGAFVSGGTLIVKSASILREPTRQYIDSSFVVLDRTATYGLTLRQIADYAAMRSLARTREPLPGGGINTILSLFDKSAPMHPAGITSADMAYLQALYAREGAESGVQERARIARRISKGHE
ncbi:MAG: hypothetical protein K2X73_06425 [Sphingomonas sp.]|uniref:hypothetical protein n=1 Tax=Sphingomonas sp. TaxID=28214 RepID=UPI0025F0AB9D|nr:hypothetical protein [Sphingomonas sp.]MBX9881594.1 hypothetical protein [Sphingomonas sp.]